MINSSGRIGNRVGMSLKRREDASIHRIDNAKAK